MKPMISLGRGYQVFVSLLFIFLTAKSVAQEETFCITPDGTNPSSLGYSGSTDVAALPNNDILVYNIYFWEIRRDDGSTDNELTRDEALNMVADLNIEYNSYNIFFKYYGMEVLNNTDYYIAPIFGGDERILRYMEDNGHMQANSFNVYVPYRFEEGGAGYAERNTRNLVINASNVTNEKVSVHEIGHNFDLSHTHRNWANSSCERVTRNESDPSYNANVAGDAVTDTAAVPNFRREYCFEQGIPPAECEDFLVYVDESSCQYIGDGDDCGGVLYLISQSDVRNTMSYSYASCRDQFTDGQIVRMREAITNDVNGDFAAAETSVDQLYEPYEGSYYFAGPVLPEHTPLFQPGFEYRFVECDCNCPAPADYDDISFSYNDNVVLSQFPKDESNYGSITHPNHSAIQIVHNDPVFMPQPRKCYDNNNKSPSGGSVTRFNDGTFNTNVTVTPKDSIGINDQHLIQNLQNGLYKIDKTYDDGSTQQTVIQKGNNN